MDKNSEPSRRSLSSEIRFLVHINKINSTSTYSWAALTCAQRLLSVNISKLFRKDAGVVVVAQFQAWGRVGSSPVALVIQDGMEEEPVLSVRSFIRQKRWSRDRKRRDVSWLHIVFWFPGFLIELIDSWGHDITSCLVSGPPAAVPSWKMILRFSLHVLSFSWKLKLSSF